MSLSDCDKCWSTPCVCGYMYSRFSQSELIHLLVGILSYQDRETREEILSTVRQSLPEDVKAKAPA